MRRYGGELVYHRRDDEGVLEVVETHGVRALHFGTPARQSAFSIGNPRRLELPYVRAMLSPLLFNADPHSVLLLGLGGGSLAKFLLEEFPNCRVDAVERRASVVDVARAYFFLPSNERLAIHIAEAAHWVDELAKNSFRQYDLILIDAYNHMGMDASVNGAEFLSRCAALMSSRGALSMNLWGSHETALKKSLTLLKSCFPGKALKLAVPNRGNVIGMGFGDEFDTLDIKRAAPRAHELEFRIGLEMPYFLRNLRWIT